ncbi:MAG: hypothetical protein ACREDG_05650 [Methylocella sp.]
MTPQKPQNETTHIGNTSVAVLAESTSRYVAAQVVTAGGGKCILGLEGNAPMNIIGRNIETGGGDLCRRSSISMSCDMPWSTGSESQPT